VSKREKLLTRLQTIPTNFTWDELVAVLKAFEYKELQGSGSRVKFDNGNPQDLISLHKPHPGSIVKPYLLKQIIEKLKNAGYLP